MTKNTKIIQLVLVSLGITLILAVYWIYPELIEKKNEQHNQEWSWDETPEVLAAIEQLHKSSQVVKDIGDIKKVHVGNANYAPLKPRRKV